MTETKRNPLLALFLSVTTVGLGQMYNGQLKKGVLLWLSVILVALSAELIYKFAFLFHRISLTVAGFLVAALIGLYLFNIADAVRSALKVRALVLKPYNKWYLYLLIIAICSIGSMGVLVKSAVGIQLYKIGSNSMEPALVIGDRVMADTNYYRGRPVARYDVILYPLPLDKSKIYTHRVIAIGDETIEIKDKRILIDGQPLNDSYGVFRDDNVIPRRDHFGPVKVPLGSVFVLGDNRDRSLDSRFHGLVRTDEITGKIVYIVDSKVGNRVGVKIR